MLRSPSHLARVLTAVLLAAVPATGVLAQADPGRFGDSRPTIQIIDLDFAGGTAAEFVKAVRAKAGDVNIVVTPHLDLVPVEPVELRAVSIGSALQLLEGMYEDAEDHRGVKLDLEITPARGAGELPVYKLITQVATPRAWSMRTGVWSLAEIIAAGRKAADVLTAIEASLELYEADLPTPRLRFHRETELLIVAPTVLQIDTIEEMIDKLSDQDPAGPQVEKAEAAAATERVRAEATTQIGRLEAEVAELSAHVGLLTRSAAEWQAKAELYMREADAAAVRQAELTEQVVRGQIQLDTIANRHRLEIEALRQKLKEAGGAR